jgi:hypothetical protein
MIYIYTILLYFYKNILNRNLSNIFLKLKLHNIIVSFSYSVLVMHYNCIS